MIPGLRLAYMVVPPSLAGPLAATQRASGLYAGAIPQAALADFIDGGQYRAHLKRIRSLYRMRGRFLAGALRGALGNRVQVADPVGGVQLAARFAETVDDRSLAEAVNARGFGVAALSAYALDADVRGLVIGFASATHTDAAACVAAVAAALSRPDTGARAAPSRCRKCRKAAGEESPGSMETRCRVTPGGGDPRESATESKPLRFRRGFAG
jgi:GntR family transcriptional regulator/MocR family aminotransferase